MTDRPDVPELLSAPEGRQLDVKSQSYDLSDRQSKAAFAKDLAAMANTPRQSDAFILLGVAEQHDGTNKIVGLANAPDDSNFQGVAKSYLHPAPDFLFYTQHHDGALVGILQIYRSLSQPIVSRKQHGKSKGHHEAFLEKGAIYLRKGSTNAKATEEDVKSIWRWLATGEVDEPETPNAHALPVSWPHYLENVEALQTAGTRHLLVLGQEFQDDGAELENIGFGPWSGIIDLSRNGPDGSMHKHVTDILSTYNHRVVRVRDLETTEIEHDTSARSTIWYFPRSAVGSQPNSTRDKAQDATQASHRQWWQNEAGRDLRQRFASWAHAWPTQNIYVTILWQHNDFDRWLRDILRELKFAFEDRISFVFVTHDAGLCNELAAEYPLDDDSPDGLVIEMTYRGFAHGIEHHCAQPELRAQKIELPGRRGAPILLDREDVNWIEEEVKLVYPGIHRSEHVIATEDTQPSRDFLQGGTISWKSLDLNKDARRSITSRLVEAVREDLKRVANGRRLVRQVTLVHTPGAGGTTLGRRVLWELHLTYPTGILCSTSRSGAQHTADRLTALARSTEMPVLLLVDSADVDDGELDAVKREVEQKQVGVIILRTQRASELPRERDHRLVLPGTLDEDELSRFVEVLKGDIGDQPGRIRALEREAQRGMVHPAYLALAAYDENWQGLESFVSVRIANLSPERREALTYLAIADAFAQLGIPARAFRTVFHSHGTAMRELSVVFGASAAELLVSFSDDTWRIGHALVAREILRQVVSRSAEGFERHPDQGLTDEAIRFIRFCRGPSLDEGSGMSDLATAAFTDRRDRMDENVRETLGPLLLALPEVSREGVFRKLVGMDGFPGFRFHHHFWLHLSRYYRQHLRDPAKALEAAEECVRLSGGNDGLAFHTRGMAHRALLYDVMDRERGLSIDSTGSELSEWAHMAEKAAADFDVARRINPWDTHGWISEIQMLIRIVERLVGARRLGKLSTLTSAPTFLAEAHFRAQDLLEELQASRIRLGEGADSYERSVAASLDELHGDYDAAIDEFKSMLAAGIGSPRGVRRRLVSLYLRKHGARWQAMSRQETNEARSMLRDNVRSIDASGTDVRRYLEVVRHVENQPSVVDVLEDIELLRLHEDAPVEASFYSYVLHCLLCLSGRRSSPNRVERLIAECQRRIVGERRRRHSSEWLGEGVEFQRLVSESELGEWRGDVDDGPVWTDGHKLRRVDCRVKTIVSGGRGELWVENVGLVAFFNPGLVRPVALERGRDELRSVTAVIGFSYDGLRAWDVRGD